MSEKLTPLIAESYELYKKTKKQLATLKVRTFKGLARRKRGTLLKQIPDLSPHALFNCESALKERKLDFVSDSIISPEKHHRGVSLRDCSYLWGMGIVSLRHISKISPEIFIRHNNLTVRAFQYLETTAVELGYKPPRNDFRELGLSACAQKWLFDEQRLYSVEDLQKSRFFIEYRWVMTRGTIHASCRREVLYRLQQHGIELPRSKDKKRTP